MEIIKDCDASTARSERVDTSFLRFIAIFLITNSHLDSLYPIPQLGTGGSLGNALFFMVSGYGLALSDRHKQRDFPNWYLRRILRIYPSVILTVGIFYFWLAGGWRQWSASDYLIAFVWPTPAWFISALMIFYILFFAVMKLKAFAAYIMTFLVLFIPYFFYYFTRVDLSHYTIESLGYIKWIFYFQIMLCGGIFAKAEENMPKGELRHFIFLVGLLCCYYGLLFSISRGYGSRFQAFVHLLTFPIVYCTMLLSRSLWVQAHIMSRKLSASLVALMSGLTLEIYLLQGFVYMHPFVQSLVFPVNILVFWLAVTVMSLVLSKISAGVRRAVPLSLR